MKLYISLLTAFTFAFFCASYSYAQHNLQIDDGHGHYTIITSSNPGGTYIIPPGGGTFLTSASGGGGGSYWQLTGNAGTTPGTNFLGTIDNKAFEIHVYDGYATANEGTGRAFRIEATTGFQSAPNIIGGYKGNFVFAGVVGATIAGGGRVGALNRVTDPGGFVGGGYNNQTGVGDGSGQLAVVVGGSQNKSSGIVSFIGGGINNNATGSESAVICGITNTAFGNYSAVMGGLYNLATGIGSFIGGGGDPVSSAGNQTIGDYSVVVGGTKNIANGAGSFIGGGGYDGTTTKGNWAGGKASVVAGGIADSAKNDYSTVSGGNGNVASGAYSTVGGGVTNYASGDQSFVGGGNTSHAIGGASVVGGGQTNYANGQYSATVGGLFNSTIGSASFIGAGSHNTTNGDSTVIVGGGSNAITNGGNTGALTYNAITGGASDTISNVNFALTNCFIGAGAKNTIRNDGTSESSYEGNVIAGGENNTIYNTSFSAIPGGNGLTLQGNGSFGFLGNNTGSNNMTIASANTSVFGNTNIWLANNDNTAHEFRFYEANSTASGAFPPSGINYSAFKAQPQTVDITYSLPADTPVFVGQVLAAKTSGTSPVLEWTGAPRGTVSSKTAAYTALSSDRFIFASAATVGYNITLPTAANKGQLITVTKTDATAFTITVVAATGQSIVQIGTRATLTAQGYSVTLAADGSTAWYVVAHEAADPAAIVAGIKQQNHRN